MRNRRAILFLGLALLLGLVAAMSARRWMQQQLPAVSAGPSATLVDVVVARRDVPIASALQLDQLETVKWPQTFAPAGSFQKPSDLAGRVVRRGARKGEPILEPLLLPAGSAAGLPSVIQEKGRAISVKVDQVIGVAGFVTPGARVDVLATLRRIDQEKALPYTKVILQDVSVLAIDQQLEETANGEPQVVNVVTLEVEPKQAEKLIYSAHEGRLQLALRNPIDKEVVTTQAASVRDILGVPRRRRAASRSVSYHKVEVLKGSDRSVKNF